MRRLAALALVPVLALVPTLTACSARGAPQPAAAAIACAAGSIRGEGSSAQTNAVNAWIRDYQIACPQATVGYDSVGSGAGVKTFVDGTGDFAGSDAALTAANRPAANARCGGTAVHLPLVVGPIALAYTVPGVGDLRLRPATVAKIFAGAATAWNDPAIAADNPGVVLPATPIVTVHRKDSSGTTDNVTRFLAATAPGDWPYGEAATWAAPGGVAETGSDGVAETVADTAGAIGYVEWSYAQFHNLDAARVGNGAGEFAALTGAAASRTVAGADTAGTGADLTLNIDYRTPAAGAYPIVLVTYEIVCSTRGPALLKSFLAYAASPAGQDVATGLGYAPLPDALRRSVSAAIRGL